MPPNPAYNWACVLYSAAEILGHAARHRAGQLAPRKPIVPTRNGDASCSSSTHQGPLNTQEATRVNGEDISTAASQNTLLPNIQKVQLQKTALSESTSKPEILQSNVPHIETLPIPVVGATAPSPPFTEKPDIAKFLEEAVTTPVASEPIDANILEHSPAEPLVVPIATRNLKSSKVPSSRIGRLFHYGGLAASLGYGAAAELIRRTGSPNEEQQSSIMMSEANIKRLVSKLVQMRGAALKLGQFMSIQDTHVLPPELDRIFRRVQDSAHYMPDWQMEEVMKTALGADWLSTNFVSFDRIPFAAASIGQVHNAILSASVSPTGKEEPVAVKIQFPNIAASIESDLGYIKLLLTAGKLLPKGLFLDKTIHVMKSELADECDYTREASFLRQFGSPELLGEDSRFKVPWVWDGSTSTVLVMEKVNGSSVGEAEIQNLGQQERNAIASSILELCLMELFTFRAMQTDPNWTNFLWNRQTRRIELVDFGATRTYSKEFMDQWLHLLQAASEGDREQCIEWSRRVGYLTGEENEIMVDAHVTSMNLLATPFRADTPQPFSFGPGSKWAENTAEIRSLIPVMLQHRLTPPPKETYSLNRKLSGAFLLASRLGAKIDTRRSWEKITDPYRFGS